MARPSLSRLDLMDCETTRVPAESFKIGTGGRTGVVALLAAFSALYLVAVPARFLRSLKILQTRKRIGGFLVFWGAEAFIAPRQSSVPQAKETALADLPTIPCLHVTSFPSPQPPPHISFASGGRARGCCHLRRAHPFGAGAACWRL